MANHKYIHVPPLVCRAEVCLQHFGSLMTKLLLNPSVFICSYSLLSRLTVRLCKCVYCPRTSMQHARFLSYAWMYVCVYVHAECARICSVCLCVTSCCSSQHQTRILKVTNQARWPFRKIKDTFLKKRHVWFIVFYLCYSIEGQQEDVMELCFQQTPKRFEVTLTISSKPF